MTEPTWVPHPSLHGERWCYTVFETQRDDDGYIPSIVIADRAGHYPLDGRSGTVGPWHWGDSFDGARQRCAAANLERGVSAGEADAIVMSSILAAMRTPN